METREESRDRQFDMLKAPFLNAKTGEAVEAMPIGTIDMYESAVGDLYDVKVREGQEGFIVANGDGSYRYMDFDEFADSHDRKIGETTIPVHPGVTNALKDAASSLGLGLLPEANDADPETQPELHDLKKHFHGAVDHMMSVAARHARGAIRDGVLAGDAAAVDKFAQTAVDRATKEMRDRGHDDIEFNPEMYAIQRQGLNAGRHILSQDDRKAIKALDAMSRNDPESYGKVMDALASSGLDQLTQGKGVEDKEGFSEHATLLLGAPEGAGSKSRGASHRDALRSRIIDKIDDAPEWTEKGQVRATGSLRRHYDAEGKLSNDAGPAVVDENSGKIAYAIAGAIVSAVQVIGRAVGLRGPEPDVSADAKADNSGSAPKA